MIHKQNKGRLFYAIRETVILMGLYLDVIYNIICNEKHLTEFKVKTTNGTVTIKILKNL